MGEDNLNLGSVTVHFWGLDTNGEPIECPVPSLNLEDSHVRHVDFVVHKIDSDSEFTATFECKMPFRSRVRLFGFWNAVKTYFHRRQKKGE